MGKPPTKPETTSPSESPLTKELGRLTRLAPFLRVGERTGIASSVILGENDRGAMQRVSQYEDFLPLADPEQETFFHYTVSRMAGLLLLHGAIMLTPNDYCILEELAHQKRTNIATILTIITDRAILCENGAFRLLSNAEVEQMLAHHHVPAGIFATVTSLIKRVLRG